MHYAFYLSLNRLATTPMMEILIGCRRVWKCQPKCLCRKPWYKVYTFMKYYLMLVWYIYFSFFSFLIVCFTSYFVFSIAVFPHSPGVVYYHLLLRRETRIPGVAPFSFRIGIWDLSVHIGQKSYTPTAFGNLWTTPGVRCMKHASS